MRGVLEDAGIEFIPQGIRRRAEMAANNALFNDLRAISQRSASRLDAQDTMTEADLYDENGLPG